MDLHIRGLRIASRIYQTDCFLQRFLTRLSLSNRLLAIPPLIGYPAERLVPAILVVLGEDGRLYASACTESLVVRGLSGKTTRLAKARSGFDSKLQVASGSPCLSFNIAPGAVHLLNLFQNCDHAPMPPRRYSAPE
jgi:hypothetical protein